MTDRRKVLTDEELRGIAAGRDPTSTTFKFEEVTDPVDPTKEEEKTKDPVLTKTP